MVPAPVQFVGRAYDLRQAGYEYHSSMTVAARLINTSWLWANVREQGGCLRMFGRVQPPHRTAFLRLLPGPQRRRNPGGLRRHTEFPEHRGPERPGPDPADCRHIRVVGSGPSAQGPGPDGTGQIPDGQHARHAAATPGGDFGDASGACARLGRIPAGGGGGHQHRGDGIGGSLGQGRSRRCRAFPAPGRFSSDIGAKHHVRRDPRPWSGSPLVDPRRPTRGRSWPSAAQAEAWMARQAAWVAAREPEVQALVSDWNPHRSRLNDLAEGPLRGMLAGIKDIFHVDGLPTRGGTSLPVEALSGATGNAVNRLVRAGALMAAKTVTTEFAYFEPGPTTNPWHASRTPGGSSSGSAAGVAAGYFDVALGTQTVGSVIRPAAFCGVPGYKPTLGAIRRDGLLVFSRTVDHVGLFSRTWEDMLAAADALSIAPIAPAPSETSVLGLITGPYAQQASEYMRGQVAAWCGRMEQAGFQVREVAAPVGHRTTQQPAQGLDRPRFGGPAPTVVRRLLASVPAAHGGLDRGRNARRQRPLRSLPGQQGRNPGGTARHHGGSGRGPAGQFRRPWMWRLSASPIPAIRS